METGRARHPERMARERPTLVREFDRKLCLTAAALGCTTCKELAAAFRQVNERTSFGVERAYKWLQGRAQPRERALYDDWMALLDLGRSETWLADCSAETFLETLCARRQLPQELVLRRAETFAGGAVPGLGEPHIGGDRYLCGVFATYSHAWSPYFAGRIIRGTLRVSAPLTRGRLVADYSESLPTARVHVRGPALLSGRSLYLLLREQGSDVPLFFTLFRPAPPGSVLAGLISGATFVGHDPRPSVSRILMIRQPGEAGPQNERYMDAGKSIAADLRTLGLGIADPEEVDARVGSFLRSATGTGLDQALAEDYGGLVALFDRLAIGTRTTGQG